MITSGIFIDFEALKPEQAKKLSLTDFEMLRPDCRETYHKMYPDEYEKLIKEEAEAKIRRISPSNGTVDKSIGDGAKTLLQGTEEPTQGSEYDVVSRPAHYAKTSIECIDAMIETQGVEAVKAFCVCNAFKYLWRHNEKNGDEDIKKANWYLNKAVDLMKGGQHEN